MMFKQTLIGTGQSLILSGLLAVTTGIDGCDPDADGDGYTVEAGEDCDDSNASVNPGAVEVCNGIDDNCDGEMPESDKDGDGVSVCQGDCDDLDPSVLPGMASCGWPTNASSCQQALDTGESHGDGYYDIQLSGASALVFCDMSHDSGGWTLLMVSSDDGQNTWTMQNAAYFSTDRTVFGNLEALDRDYKSIAYHELGFSDLLFVHHPSAVWASYHGVGSGRTDLGTFIDSIAYPSCYQDASAGGYPLTAGTLEVSGRLCSTRLYFNVGDHEYVDDFGISYCQDPSSYPYNGATYGPAWSAGFSEGCPLDDPEMTGLGPVNNSTAYTTDESLEERVGVGFGYAAGLNSGSPGSGSNTMWVLAR